MEQRIWRGSDTEPHFERWPGVALLLGELRAAWEAENAGLTGRASHQPA
jgi:hypothetical protein